MIDPEINYEEDGFKVKGMNCSSGCPVLLNPLNGTKLQANVRTQIF